MPLDVETRRQETGIVMIGLATITHPGLAEPVRAANNGEDVVSRGQTYLASGWKMRLPSQGEDADFEAEIEIENVDADIISDIEASPIPPEPVLEVVLSSDPDEVEIALDGYEFAEVAYDATTITGRLKLPDMKVEPAPFQRFNPTVTPGLF